MQGRVPSGGDQPEDSGHHLRREPVLLGAREEIPHRVRPAEGAHLRYRFPDGGGAAQQPEGDRSLGHSQEAGPGEREVHPPLGPQGGEHRHGAELHEPVQRDKRHG